MTIDISTYFPVSSTVINTLNDKKVFAGLGLTSNARMPTTNQLIQFSDAASVSDFFGSGSNEFKSAKKYFASYTSAKVLPPYIYFGKYLVTNVAPYIRSQKIKNSTQKLTELQSVTSGNITMLINGVLYSTTGIDLSAQTNLSGCALTIRNAVRTQNPALDASGLIFDLVFDGVLLDFIATINPSGSANTMNFFSSTGLPNLSNILGLSSSTNAILSQGSDAESATQNMERLSSQFTDQFSIYFVDNLGGLLDDVINLELSQWISDQGDRFNGLIWSNNNAIESDNDTTSIWALVNNEGLNNISIFDEVLLNNSDRVSAYAGVFASIDLTQENSAITAAFKSQLGLDASVTDTKIAKILDSKNINYYGNVGISGTKDKLSFFYGGYTSGKWTYSDNLVGQVWISVQFQIALASLFSLVGQIPNDPDGDSQVRSALSDKAESAINSGIIVKGLLFENATAQFIKTQYGVSVQEITNNGYVLVKSASSQAQRQIRESSNWFFLYAKASAIQYLPVDTTTFY